LGNGLLPGEYPPFRVIPGERLQPADEGGVRVWRGFSAATGEVVVGEENCPSREKTGRVPENRTGRVSESRMVEYRWVVAVVTPRIDAGSNAFPLS
jgi:hypothetical protein